MGSPFRRSDGARLHEVSTRARARRCRGGGLVVESPDARVGRHCESGSGVLRDRPRFVPLLRHEPLPAEPQGVAEVGRRRPSLPLHRAGGVPRVQRRLARRVGAQPNHERGAPGAVSLAHRGRHGGRYLHLGRDARRPGRVSRVPRDRAHPHRRWRLCGIQGGENVSTAADAAPDASHGGLGGSNPGPVSSTMPPPGPLTPALQQGASMQEIEKRNLVAQWAFDTRPVLLRFHLWLEDVEVHRHQAEPVSAHTFTPRGIARCLAMTSAATALGTRLFGDYGGGAGKDKQAYNQVKKGADAMSAYVMSEGLWHLTRTIPENHAIMVSLGEGLMPKAGETPEMGANPLLGFGRVYARPEVARTVDRRVRRL